MGDPDNYQGLGLKCGSLFWFFGRIQVNRQKICLQKQRSLMVVFNLPEVHKEDMFIVNIVTRDTCMTAHIFQNLINLLQNPVRLSG